MAEPRRLRATPARKPEAKPTTSSRPASRRTMSSAYGTEQEHDEDLGDLCVVPEGVEPATVRAAAGVTRNLGNYESLRIDVAVTVPCQPKDLERAYKLAAQFVADKLSEETEEWLGSSMQEGGRR